MYFTTVVLATLLALPSSLAQQAADGALVPFTSSLPPCASQCGPLYDVQGGCAPPVRPSPDQSCFCGDARLQPFRQSGTAGVSQVCGAASCTDPSDLQAVKDWYQTFCGSASSNPGATSTRTGAGATNTGSSSSGGSSSGKSSGGGHQTWFEAHTKWVIMIIVIFVGLIAIWVGAWFLRRRYLRKKEREIEMRPPVAWGPHQMQGATGGYTYGDGVVDASAGAAAAGGHQKEMTGSSAVPQSGKRLSKAKMGWFSAHKE